VTHGVAPSSPLPPAHPPTHAQALSPTLTFLRSGEAGEQLDAVTLLGSICEKRPGAAAFLVAEGALPPVAKLVASGASVLLVLSHEPRLAPKGASCFRVLTKYCNCTCICGGGGGVRCRAIVVLGINLYKLGGTAVIRGEPDWFLNPYGPPGSKDIYSPAKCICVAHPVLNAKAQLLSSHGIRCCRCPPHPLGGVWGTSDRDPYKLDANPPTCRCDLHGSCTLLTLVQCC